MGILAASITYGVSDFVKEKRSEQHVMGLWSQLSTLRARAIRDDVPYVVEFTPGSSNTPTTYVIYRRNNGESGYEKGVYASVASGFMGASGDITFGFPSTTPSAFPITAYNVTEPVQGDWKDVDASGTFTNSIIFENNEIGSISEGAIFIKNTAFKSRGYAIVKANNSHTIKLWKWNGSKWYEM